MLRNLLLTLLYTCVQPLSAQEFQTTFFGETQGGDYLPGYIAGLPDGGAYMVGQTNRASSGGYHVLLIRTDAQGNRLWERTYHAGAGTWVAVTPDGGCVLGGYSLRHPFGTEQGFVSKIDAQGESAWTQYFSQGNHSEIQEVKPLANGEYAVCGIVSQPDSTGQNVFWARLSASGGLMMYEEIALENGDHSPSILETRDHHFVLCWEAHLAEMIRCFQPDGQLIWEKNLFDLGYNGRYPGAIQDTTGDLWVTGMYTADLGAPITPNILRLAVQNGSLKQQIPSEFQSFPARPMAGHVESDGSIVFYAANALVLVRLTYNLQGTYLARDTLPNQGFVVEGLDLSTPGRPLMLRRENLHSHPGRMVVQPIVSTPNAFALQSKWELSANNPFNHELFEAACAAQSGGTFVLFRGNPRSGTDYSSGNYILKLEPDGQILGPVYLGDEQGNIALNGQLQPTRDGGVIALVEGDKAWKLDWKLKEEWLWKTERGQLIAGAENDFFVVERKGPSKVFEPIKVHHYQANGIIDKTLEVFSKNQDYYFTGGVSQLNNGPVLFGVQYDEAGIGQNWVIYMDRNGDLASEQLLPKTYRPLALNYENRFIQTSDGGVLAASPNGNEIYLLKVKDGKASWDATFSNGTPEEATMQLLGIEEVPCQGYVLSVLTNAYQGNAPRIIPESSQTILLYHLDEHGQGQKIFSYRPLPEPSSPNTDFIPGYTYRRWGHLLNEQTYDLLLETVHFPDSLAIQHPAAELVLAPNPSAYETCLEYHSDDYGVMEIQVFNEAGQLMDHFFSKKTEAIWHQPYRSRGPSGTYMIRTRLNGQAWISRRWVKAY
jgi:hypothetical protein